MLFIVYLRLFLCGLVAVAVSVLFYLLLRFTKFRNLKPMVIQIIIGVAFGGYRYYDYTVVTSLGKEYANAFPFTEVTRGDSDDAVETELTTLFDNIAQGKNLKQSVAQLDVLWELSHSEIYNNYTEYEPYIGWYLAIGYLQSNNKKQAKCVLECLKDISINESLLGDTVSKILSEI